MIVRVFIFVLVALLSTSAFAEELLTEEELVELEKILTPEEIEQIKLILVSNEADSVQLIQNLLSESDKADTVVTVILKKKPELVTSVITVAATLETEVTETVIEAAKETLPEKENEIIVLSLSEGIDPDVVSEATAAGNEPANEEQVSEPVVDDPLPEVNDEQIDSADSTVLDINPIIDSGGVASPN